MLTAIPRFYMDESRQFCFFIGPRLNWLVSAKYQIYENGEKRGDEIDFLDEKMPEEQKFKRINFGMLLGIDYELDNGILLGSESNIGFMSITKSDDTSTVPISTGFTLGYNFAKLL